jgi:hypothetical protein
MVSFAKLGAYAAWIAVALAAAAARPAAADLFDNLRNEPAGDTVTGSWDDTGADAGRQTDPAIPPRSETFNEAWSFADQDETMPVPPTRDDVGVPEEDTTAAPSGPTAFADADLLVGTWAWEGTVEGVQAYMETAFYPDGTYESVIDTPVIRLYETGTWALMGGMLSTVVIDYSPRVIQTATGPQPLEWEQQSTIPVAFLDQDTLETEIGLCYRID